MLPHTRIVRSKTDSCLIELAMLGLNSNLPLGGAEIVEADGSLITSRALALFGIQRAKPRSKRERIRREILDLEDICRCICIS